LDGGLLQEDRRRTQAAADAAALAAAENLFSNYPKNSGVDNGNKAQARALAIAAANGFNNDGPTNTVVVNIPPKSGIHANMAGYAEVIITYNQKRGFSSIFGGGDIPVRARAVAIGQWVPFRNGILVLDPTSPQSLNDNGGGSI